MFQVEKIPLLNITLVYDALPLEKVNRDAVRKAIGAPDIVAMDTPDLLVMVSGASGLFVQFGDRRIRVNAQSGSAPCKSELPDLAARLHRSIKGSALEAYGFNYDVLLKVEAGNATQLVKARFLPEEERVAASLDAEVQAILPRIIFTRAGRRYDLILEAVDEERLKAHMNVHIEAKKLLDLASLRQSFCREYDEIVPVLSGFLK